MNFKYDKIINTAISVFFYEWAEEYKKRKNFPSAIECFNVYLAAKPINSRISLKKAIKLGMKLYIAYGVTFLFAKKNHTIK